MNEMDYAEFKVAFWHPFGAHGGETTEEILSRKTREVDANGWTLWSFQHRTTRTLRAWHCEILASWPGEVFAFCSKSPKAIDPGGAGSRSRLVDCEYYQLVNEPQSHRVPEHVRIVHPFPPGEPIIPSAFVVGSIIHPASLDFSPGVKWFSQRKGPWCPGPIPTRGEYLIQRGGSAALRPIIAVLRLKPPYLARVGVEPANLFC